MLSFEQLLLMKREPLAESYFLNGLYEKATDAAYNDLESSEEGNGIILEVDLDYYKKRLKQMAGE